MRVLMLPTLSSVKSSTESGIKRVVEAYAEYGPRHNIQFVECDPRDHDQYDVLAVHAGMIDRFPSNKPLVSILHGLYWTSDYDAQNWEYNTNASVVSAIRNSKLITVPSKWVAEVLQRDMRVNPYVIPHGIDVKLWEHNKENGGYVLWNKNRAMDVCDPTALGLLALKRPNIPFVSTFAPRDMAQNISVTGIVPHLQMKDMVQRAGVYLSTTKETFGIGILEAMASGVPVLGFNHGGNRELIQHGVNGYLAEPGNYEDLAIGLDYCLQYRDILGAQGRELSRYYTWDAAVEGLAKVFEAALKYEPPTAAIIIPCYNYANKVGRAIESAINQDYKQLTRIIVVDDGSDDEQAVREVVRSYSEKDSRVTMVRKPNGGVATARNIGVWLAVGVKYICCLDADDAIDPRFLSACIPALEHDPSLGVAYTGITAIDREGNEEVSKWPGDFDYDAMLERHNQIPTCAVVRREAWERLGGQKQRYAPNGCGAEDAEFWLRMGAYGWNARKVTDAGLFIYSLGQGYTSQNYQEVDWTALHPWTKDFQHPFASVATPKRLSHPVRQYDEPEISVVIPVSKAHVGMVPDALDSLESQTFRKWEAVIVADMVYESDEADLLRRTLKPYPYARVFYTGAALGAGAARNLGAKEARAKLLLFLDADDWLYPEALRMMQETYIYSRTIVYTDYVGKAYMEEAVARSRPDRFLYYDHKHGEAVLRHYASNFDCEMAVRQPTADMYIWCLISSLVPKKWHNEIGGFDETMESWEDWDYWIRMARAGKCFTRIEEPLVVYRFYTGERREQGLHSAQKLIQYLMRKHDGEPEPMCNCAKNKVTMPSGYIDRITQSSGGAEMGLKDSDTVMVRYTPGSLGEHRVVGASGQDYGYRGAGEIFLVKAIDIQYQPDIFIPVQQIQSETEPEVSAGPTVPPPAPIALSKQAVVEEVIQEVNDLATIPGMTPELVMKLQAVGVTTVPELIQYGKKNLLTIEGVGPAKANKIFKAISA